MKFIDKTQREAEGRALNVEFLKSIFDSGSHTFAIPLDKSAYRKYVQDFPQSDTWRRLLCEEQSYLCCYCMRKLSPVSGFSVEHVVPQSLRGEKDRAEFNRYICGPVFAENIRAGVEYSEDVEKCTFSSADDVDSLPKMPHVIAHHNLLAACKGIRGTLPEGCCCNNHRGRDFIVPFMLIPDGQLRFKYDVNGLVIMDPKDESWDNIIDILNSQTLQDIRHIWYRIAKNTRYEVRHFAYETPELQRMQIFKTAFRKDNYLNVPPVYRVYAGSIMRKGNDFAWRLLVDYSWFLYYYRIRH